MKVIFKLYQAQIEALSVELSGTGFTLSNPLDGQYVELDTENKSYYMAHKEIPKDRDPSYVLHIKEDEDVVFLVKVLEKREVARFNANKPRFTYVDFRLFEGMEDGCKDINDIQGYESDYYHDILFTLSAIAFEDDIPFQLKRLQALCYRLSLIFYRRDNPSISVDKKSNLYRLEAFEEMSRVLHFGAKKYARNNWRNPSDDKLQSGDSLERHIKSMIAGEMIDPDSGFHHMGHVMCNVMFLTYQFTQNE